MNNNEAFAERMREEVLPLFRSQAELARTAGVSGSTVRKWMAGETMAKVAPLKRIAKEKGLRLEFLQFGELPIRQDLSPPRSIDREMLLTVVSQIIQSADLGVMPADEITDLIADMYEEDDPDTRLKFLRWARRGVGGGDE